MTYVSDHARKRMRERNGLNKKSIDRIADKAYKYGLKHGETTGRLNKWITKLYFVNRDANSIRIYGDKVYIFSNDFLITVFKVPNNLLNTVRANKKQKVAKISAKK